MKPNLTLEIDTKALDEAIKKANQLLELLQQATQIISSLNGYKI
ncbi:hypothetical protein [Youxingia wuxianensis]|nr:hypothetical protein [Youxingia wuxianensis]